jgi:acyl transferase domain-containing protein
VTSFWKLVKDGEVAFEAVPGERWQHASFFDPGDLRAPDKTYIGRGGYLDEVDQFPALHYGLAPRRVQVTDPQQRLAIELVRQAIADAGYEKRPFDRTMTGVFMGASVSEFKDLMTVRHRVQQLIDGAYGDPLSPAEAQAVRAGVGDMAPLRAFSITGSSLNMIACSVAQTFDFNGPAMQLDTACSSALVAVHQAALYLRAGQCDVAFAGGVYLNLSPDNLVGFARIGAISPSGNCRPFDRRADGFVMGEGIGVVMLKRLEDAQRDGDRIYAVLKGSACNNDGRGEGPMTPRGEGQKEAIRRAHKEAGLPIETIGYVETHGTGTAVGDVTEVAALTSYFRERGASGTGRCALGSIKANVGHTMSAAGAAGFIKTCLMLHHGVLPVQAGCEELNPALELPSSPFRVPARTEPWTEPEGQPRRAAVSAFGFGGTNAHVVLEQAPARPAVTRSEAYTLRLSAPTPELLRSHAGAMAQALEGVGYEVGDLARTLALREEAAEEVCFSASTPAEVSAALTAVAQGGRVETAVPEEEHIPVPEGSLLTLPPPPLETQSYWLKDTAPRAPRARIVEAAVPAAVAAPAVLEPVISLFQRQMQLLQTQLEVVQAQSAAMSASFGETRLAADGAEARHSNGSSAEAAASRREVELDSPRSPPASNGAQRPKNGH